MIEYAYTSSSSTQLYKYTYCSCQVKLKVRLAMVINIQRYHLNMSHFIILMLWVFDTLFRSTSPDLWVIYTT